MPGITFRSKIGFEILIPLTLIISALTAVTIFQEAWGGLFVMIIAIAFISSFYLNTSYQLTSDGQLIITCGFFRSAIAVASIRKIRYIKNILSSPALSIDRLEIHYNKFDSILISPKDRSDFIERIRKLNQDIEISNN